MAFQFQAIGALSPYYRETFGFSLADIGVLIGLYFAPGLALALPGGALGRRFGDKRMVLVGFGLMIAGGVLMAAAHDYPAQVAGRLTAGVGGILLNVLMSKMVADWFVGREISLAMSIFTNSWPLGIALALITLPLSAEAMDIFGALWVVAGLTVAGFLFMALGYRPPKGAAPAGSLDITRLAGPALYAAIWAGAIWGLYNVALTIVFSFGPELFIARGWNPAEAGSATSIVLWMLAIGSPLAGLLADRSGRRNLVLVAGLTLFGASLALGALGVGDMLTLIVLIGAASGFAVGPMMSLPAAVLSASQRAMGMGVFFTMHYVCSLIGPVVAGALADATGGVEATFWLAAACNVAAVLCLVPYRSIAARAPKPA